MTADDRVKAVAEFGFTERQARFLVLVMRHAGVCLLRQYSTFAGIVHGQKTRAFFQKLVRRGLASAYACRHNRGQLYHVHHFGLYRAIEQPNSPHRRPVPAGRIRDRLMVLDAVLGDAELRWLVSAAEKTAYFTSLAAPVLCENLPRRTRNAGSTSVTDAFPDKHPIGIDPIGRVVLLYVLLPSSRDDFRGFLDRHCGLLACLPSWTLRLVLPRELAHGYGAYQAVVREEWESPLHPRTVEELKWYFEQLRTTSRARVQPGTDERLDRAAQAFERPRFSRLYRRWLRDGDHALADVSSAVISEALAARAGRVECLVLPHRYDHLSPLVDIVGSPSGEAERANMQSDEVRKSARLAYQSVEPESLASLPPPHL